METGYPDGWDEVDGALQRTFEFANFVDAIAFVNRVADAAEQANHHPDISIHGYRHVTLRYWTHSKNAITENDIAQARQAAELSG